MDRLRVASCQLNPIVGDLDGNVAAIIAAVEQAEDAGADLAVFGELAICGYPPEDLLLKPRFIADCRAALEKLAARTGRCAVVVGFPDADRDLYNAAALCASGEVATVYRKRHLPNYDVFDEKRYFTPGDGESPLVEVAGVTIGLSICEDSWVPFGPIAEQAAAGAEVMVNINGSPYRRGKAAERERMLATRAADASAAIIWTNQVGGQDELVFDGSSVIIDPTGAVVARSPQFAEHVLVHDLVLRPQWRKRQLDPRGRPRPPIRPVIAVSDAVTRTDEPVHGGIEPVLGDEAEVYGALVQGTRDYIRKNGFTDVVLGLSGGIDSSLCTVIAADAIGADHVRCVALPSRYSTEHSISDAEALCTNLGVALSEIAIEPAFAAMLEMLAPTFEGTEPDVTEENLQGRIRAALLMAMANKFRGLLVLICGNKSELAVGYTTIYGVDMAGGFAPIRDIPKTLVYRLARWRNAQPDGPVIPENVITKPPSAELAPDQKDSDNLPPYEELDPILERYIEDDWTAAELIDAGFDEALVRRITRLVDVAEWKRRQAPVGPRVTAKAFGKDRRLPITNAYRS
ncbi:NAD+ synthase [Actinospongicola halichondriae]|uniref:NAD+ synthase n=1 Tax=Actinospongicola halichondriae TaxID=3236844 RepID=UPI003D5BF3AC